MGTPPHLTLNRSFLSTVSPELDAGKAQRHQEMVWQGITRTRKSQRPQECFLCPPILTDFQQFILPTSTILSSYADTREPWHYGAGSLGGGCAGPRGVTTAGGRTPAAAKMAAALPWRSVRSR